MILFYRLIDSIAQIDLPTAGAMTFNFAVSVGIVILNKLIFIDYGFVYGTALTFLHFVVTFLGMSAMGVSGFFEIKKLPITPILYLCVYFCGFVVFNNLSLQYNSVGFYQLMKVATTPVIGGINYFFYKIQIPMDQTICLVVICIGVILASVTDVSINFMGLVYAVCGVLSTSLYQIKVGSLTKQLNASPELMLLYQAPISAVMLIPLVPMFDDMQGLWTYEFNPANLSAVIMSSLLAFGVNLSIFLVITKTSPLSYNVLGHFKLCVILLSGFLLFGENASPQRLLGVFTTLMSVFYYTHLNLQMRKEAQMLAVKKESDKPSHGK